jgi:hypothetical protein
MKAQALFHSKDGVLRDALGRERIFRGMNLSGGKVPFSPDGETRLPGSLFPARGVSFTGRPFPEAEGDEHFSRLRSIGCTLIRWNLTWEAVEHENPREYDEDFLAYLRRLLLKAEDYGIHVFIDPHQDVWSRWTGGDGAPLWTLEKCGINAANLESTGAAFTHQGEGDSYGDMTWSLNYQRYACATLFTLFFGGGVFAPDFLIEGLPADEFLQSHFIAAMAHTARRIKDCKAVIGFGIMNEPHPGFIGIGNLAEPASPMAAQGWSMSPFEGMKAASGLPADMRRFKPGAGGPRLYGKPRRILPPEGGLFLPGFSCPWKAAGVWEAGDSGEGVLLKKDYFASISGRAVSFTDDFYKPFQKKFIAAMEEKRPQYLFFAEGSADAARTTWNNGDREREKLVDAFHWYDVFPLVLKRWLPHLAVESDTRKIVLGKGRVRKSFTAQLARRAGPIRAESIPPLLGEFGVPFDLDNGASFRTGDYTGQFEALSAYYDSLDELLLSCTLWNYTAFNTHAGGDGWNREDLSVFCKDDGGLRIPKAYCRPFAMAVRGKLHRMRFLQGPPPAFEMEWESEPVPEDADPSQATEVFVPDLWFPQGWKVDLAQGGFRLIPKPEDQRLFILTPQAGPCKLRIISC